MSGPNRVIPPLNVDPDGTFDSRYWPRSEPLPEGPQGPQGPEGPQGPKSITVSTTPPSGAEKGDLWYDPDGEPTNGVGGGGGGGSVFISETEPPAPENGAMWVNPATGDV